MKFYKRTLIFSFLIICTCLYLKNAYSRHFHTDSGMQKIIDENGASCLYIGSSAFRQGLNIFVLEEHNPDTFILSYNGNQPYAEYMELEYLLDNQCSFKTVVIDMYAYSANCEPWINDTRLLYDSDLNFKYNLWQELSKSGKYSVSTVWDMFITSNNELFFLNPIYTLLTANRYYKGGNTQVRDGSYSEILENKADLQNGSNNIDMRQATAITNIINLCNENRIDIYFLETPKYVSITESEEYISVMNQYIQTVTELGVNCLISEKTYENYIQENNLINEQDKYIHCYKFNHDNPEFYYDLIHLSSLGSKKFTEEILINF